MVVVVVVMMMMGFVITSLFFAACSINAIYWQEEEEISLVFPQTNLPPAAVCLLRSGWHPTFLGIPELLRKTLGRGFFFFFKKIYCWVLWISFSESDNNIGHPGIGFFPSLQTSLNSTMDIYC